VRDNNTGIVYEMVQVNGKPVVVAAGKMKPKETEKPVNNEPAATPNKNTPTVAVPAPPPEFANRIVAMEQANAKRVTDEAAALSAKKSKMEADKKAIEWLTLDRIKVLKPDEAYKFLKQYGNVLTTDQQRALRRRT